MRNYFLPLLASLFLLSACGDVTIVTGTVDPGTNGVTNTTTGNGKTPPTGNVSLSAAALTTAEDTAVTVNLTANAATSVAIALGISSQPSHGSLTGVPATFSGTNLAASFTYTPFADYNGTDSFTVKAVSDNTEATTTITVTVTPVNDPPSFQPTTVSLNVPEDSGSYNSLWATAIKAGPPDESTQSLSFALNNDNPALFVVQPAISETGVLIFTPTPNAFGQASVVVSLTDDGGTANGGLDSVSVTLILTVVPVNDPPSFVAGGNQLVNEDSGAGLVAGWASSLMPGPPNEAGQSLHFELANSNPGMFAVQPAIASNGDLSWTAAADKNGVAILTITLLDNGGTTTGGSARSTPATRNITITAVNDAPLAVTPGTPLQGAESLAFFYPGWANPLTAGPPDELQALTITSTVDNPGLFTVLPRLDANGSLSWTAANAPGTALITFYIDDNGGTPNGGVARTVIQTRATIQTVNNPPSFSGAASQYTWEDTGPVIVVDWATSITMGPPDEVWQAGNFTVFANNPALFAQQPTVSTNGTLYYTPAANAFGSADLTVTLTDNGGGLTNTATRLSRIEVLPVNDRPVFVPEADPVVAEDSGSYIGSAWAGVIWTGPANELQTYAFVVTNSQPSLFAQQPTLDTAGTLYFVPAANANGAAVMTVTLVDSGDTLRGGSNSITQVANITILSVNDAPSFVPGSDENILEDAGLQTVPAWASAITFGPPQEAPQSVSFAVTTDSPGLFVSLPTISNAGELTYTPAADANGSALVMATAWDNGGVTNGGVDRSASVFFTINVVAVNDAPSFVTSNVTVSEDAGAQNYASWAAPVVAGPGNESTQVLLPFVLFNSDNALFSQQPALASDGTLTFTPATNANGSAIVGAVLSDGGGSTNGGTDTTVLNFVITVTPLNDAPTTVSDTALTISGTQVAIDVLANDWDVDGDILSLAGISGATSGTLGNTGNIVNYTPNPGFVGTDSFVYWVFDGTVSVTETASVTVTADTHSPAFVPASSWPVTGNLLGFDDAYGSGKQFGPARFVFDDPGLQANAVTVSVTQAGLPLSNGTDFWVGSTVPGQIDVFLNITNTTQTGDLIRFSLRGVSDVNGNRGSDVTIDIIYDGRSPNFYNYSSNGTGMYALLQFDETVTSSVSDPVHFFVDSSNAPITVEPNHDGIYGQGWASRKVTRDTYFWVPRDRLPMGETYRIEATQFTDVAGNPAVGTTVDVRTVCCDGPMGINLVEINFVNRPTGTTVYRLAPAEITNDAFTVTQWLAGQDLDVDVVLDQALDPAKLSENELKAPFPEETKALVTVKTSYSSNDTLHFSLKDASPTFAWQTSSKYHLRVSANLAVGGGGYYRNFVFFVRRGNLDTTAPTILAATALRGISGSTTQIVRYEEPLRIGFSEEIDVTSLNNSTLQIWRDYGGNVTTALLAKAVADDRDEGFFVRAVDASGSPLPLTDGNYIVAVNGIKDLATPANLSANIRLPFKVAADIPVAPQFVTSTPKNGDSKVDSGLQITLAFSEAMAGRSFRDDGLVSARGFELIRLLGGVWIPSRVLQPHTNGNDMMFDSTQIIQLRADSGAAPDSQFKLRLLPGLASSSGTPVDVGTLTSIDFATTPTNTTDTLPKLQYISAGYGLNTQNAMTFGGQPLDNEFTYNLNAEDRDPGDQWTFRVSDATGDSFTTTSAASAVFMGNLTGSALAPMLTTSQANYYWLAITDLAGNTTEMINGMWVMNPQTLTDATPAVTDAGNGAGTFRFSGTVLDVNDATHIYTATIYILPVITSMSPPMAIGIAYRAMAQITRNADGTLSYALSMSADQALSKQAPGMAYMVGISLQPASLIGMQSRSGELISVQPTPFNVP